MGHLKHSPFALGEATLGVNTVTGWSKMASKCCDDEVEIVQDVMRAVYR